jgi:GDP-L-fucose synthase
MNILITGASGFLGSHLMSALKGKGHTLVLLDSKVCDLTKVDSLRKFDDLRYDQIFHLAAWTQAGDFCLYHPGEQWIINQKINTNVLSWWSEKQPQAKLIAIGTSCSYPPDRILEEKNYLEGQPIDSLFTYAMTKRMLHVGLLSLQKQYGLKYLNLVPSTLYGPDYHTDERQMHFIFDLILKIIRGKKYGEQVILWGDGYQRRELVYVHDFVNIAIKISQSVDNDIVNIGAGEDYSIREFAKIICDIVEFDFEQIQFDTTKYTGAKSKCLNIKKLKKIIPDIKLLDIHLGIERTIKWFNDSYFKDSNHITRINNVT